MFHISCLAVIALFGLVDVVKTQETKDYSVVTTTQPDTKYTKSNWKTTPYSSDGSNNKDGYTATPHYRRYTTGHNGDLNTGHYRTNGYRDQYTTPYYSRYTTSYYGRRTSRYGIYGTHGYGGYYRTTPDDWRYNTGYRQWRTTYDSNWPHRYYTLSYEKPFLSRSPFRTQEPPLKVTDPESGETKYLFLPNFIANSAYNAIQSTINFLKSLVSH